MTWPESYEVWEVERAKKYFRTDMLREVTMKSGDDRVLFDNIFIVGDSAPEEAVTFSPNGRDLQFSGNTFQNKPVKIVVDPSCKNAFIENNAGAVIVSKPVDFNHGRR